MSDDNHGGMGERGVSRPMAHGSGDHDGGDGGDGSMSPGQREKMLHMHHKKTLWCYWTVILLGLWTMSAPFTFGYLGEAADLGREVWMSDNVRIWGMVASEIISGLVLVVFGWRSLKPGRPISQWICCFAGIWLSAAPLLLWSPNAAAYLNATVVGALVIALTILIPGMPNMIMYMKMGGDLPKGWSYNPSSWAQRSVMIGLGFLGWLVSRYLGAFQLGYIDHMWDPFFGEGSRKVLMSNMSHMWPISDAGLGAFSYTFEFLMGWMGAPSRWRTMPWMVTFFGILVIPLGLTHILLVISQPVIVGYWCTMCLLAAAIMLPMIPLEVDEVIAMGQHVKRRVDAGEPFWRVFWKGGDASEAGQDERSPEFIEFHDRPLEVTKAAFWGMSWSWWLAACTAIGIWLMFAPTVFGFEKTIPADIHHLGGALIVTTSVISMGEVIRRGRYVNLLLGLIVGVGPWLFSGIGVTASILASVAGALVIGLSLPLGPIRESYGSWNKRISNDPTDTPSPSRHAGAEPQHA
ncbi:vitamin K epoxide reductase family protein [Persicimonas caeni]|uniref:Vitamin K epoxide reductase family protein n=1 Tax=Persicimonas caeni TaxID=2292766 RepID=A0A4Y6PMB9_PERCE|nr:vitamin K epoxide reductase family protein [Persicimonas caeni]QDG49431.1 vitamin K epoxide reductase family protein [Persicimonas caeni]QED30652.1 vitamin K epoxide reductase family protein [Persicimonas caeni]